MVLKKKFFCAYICSLKPGSCSTASRATGSSRVTPMVPSNVRAGPGRSTPALNHAAGSVAYTLGSCTASLAT